MDSERLFPKNSTIINDKKKKYIVYKDGGTCGVMLANKYDENKHKNIENWYVYEKYDGIRTIWTGSELIARPCKNKDKLLVSKIFSYVPDWFLELLPKNTSLDGELWIDRGMFDEVSGISNMTIDGKHSCQIEPLWRKVKYIVFDIPHDDTNTLKERVKQVELITKNINSKYIVNAEYKIVTNKSHLENIFKEYTNLGAEGIVLRDPNSLYEIKRSKYLLKLKLNEDSEAVVVDYEIGTGKYKNMLGSLICETISDDKSKSGIIFKVGTGLKDFHRENYEEMIPIGSIISYGYMELTKNNIPRHPTYRGVRHDIKIK